MMVVGAVIGVVANDVDFAYPNGLALSITRVASPLVAERTSFGPYSDVPGIDRLRLMSDTDALALVVDGNGAARGHQLRSLGLLADCLDSAKVGASSW
jgi:hypothetical protein